ncbi:MAG: hypothetical protein A3C55_06490 [Gammaproteobacteria bacterium RIFCSPHIGHO2_02_FULL_42_13]|nr:MAG: hypothetical protein A3C55_06490 [Gammaproteobacteria bacterium RIFCSPHIGHO2_02_FULL_42_13]OGT69513.1 MAG: hypothetical protein A3H43_01870 [Gammaproteobacteria bacterium RIFCSPLOWO2_02_FULL_42_9]
MSKIAWKFFCKLPFRKLDVLNLSPRPLHLDSILDVTPTEAQVKQGIWQAYGQIRAAQITARSTKMAAIIATGIGGGVLTLYKISVDEEKKKNEKDRAENEMTKANLGALLKKWLEKENIAKQQLDFAEKMLQTYCNKQQWIQYEEKKIKEIEEKDELAVTEYSVKKP